MATQPRTVGYYRREERRTSTTRFATISGHTLGAKTKKNVSTEHRRPPKFARRSHVTIYVADDFEGAADTALDMNWNLLQNCTNTHDVAGCYAGIVGTYAPSLLATLIRDLDTYGTNVNVVHVPSGLEELGLDDNFDSGYSHAEQVIYIAMCLLLPFKNFSNQNFGNYITNRMRALGGKLGLDDAEKAALQFPFDLSKAKKVHSVFASGLRYKRAIVDYIQWGVLQDDSHLENMCRYVDSILAWNELNLILFMRDTFVTPKSPVLQHLGVSDEVGNLCHAIFWLQTHEMPQFFRYFCTSAQEQVIRRNNFPTLGSVAIELLRKRSSNDSLQNFAGTTESGSKLVKDLVKLHEEYVRREMALDTVGRIQFLFDDGNYREAMAAKILEDEGIEDEL